MAMRSLCKLIAFAAFVVVLTGASFQAPEGGQAAPPAFDHPDYGQWLPKNYNKNGQEIDDLLHLILYITGFFFILTEVGILAFLFMYRHREGRKAVYTHGNRKLEIVWTIVPAAILVWLALYQRDVWKRHKMDLPKADDPNVTLVEVNAEQFQWVMRYPGADRKFGRTKMELMHPQDNPLGIDWKDPEAKDDVWTIGALHAPVNKPVLVTLKSKDVLHSFFLPVMRVKQDAVPGLKNNRVWFMPNTSCPRKPAVKSDGTPKPSYDDDIQNWEILCAELCGSNHFSMKGQLIIESDEHFNEWLEKRASYMGGDDE